MMVAIAAIRVCAYWGGRCIVYVPVVDGDGQRMDSLHWRVYLTCNRKRYLYRNYKRTNEQANKQTDS